MGVDKLVSKLLMMRRIYVWFCIEEMSKLNDLKDQG